MFAKFNLTVSENDVLEYHESGREFFQRYCQGMKQNLDVFIKNDHAIDGRALQDTWFSTIEEFDVLLSHSHKDEKLAVALAGFLQENLGLKAFIDSSLWGCSNDLLKDIDDTYCKQDEETYSYDKRNYTTSHVHMMLSIALTHMIDKCEAVFFINTPNSISLQKGIRCERQTTSPWIYHELSVASILREKRPERIVKRLIAEKVTTEALIIQYPLEKELESFYELSMQELKNYKNNQENALDYIYKLKGIKV